MLNSIKYKLASAKTNKLKLEDLEYLLNLLNSNFDSKEKCDIAIGLSFIKDRPELIDPIIKLLPFWDKTSYSGNIITTYSRLIVNYFHSHGRVFIDLLNDANIVVRKIMSHAFCFTILADGVNNTQARRLYNRKIKKILLNYVKSEKDQSLVKFVEDFLNQNN